MNYDKVRYLMGKILLIMSALMTAPLLVSLYYREDIYKVYVIPMAILAAIGIICVLRKPPKQEMRIKEGFLICSLSWILMSAFGALPFRISGEIPSYTDAFFETVSGFTTTGSTILTNIEGLSNSLLFWRSFTHFIGGMGVLVFALAIISQKDTKSMFIMRAEATGPKVGKLVSKTRFTARILYGIYIGLTVLQIVFLLLGDMPLFDSVTTAMATAGTGGFSIKNASIAHYGSAYIEYVIAVFMLLFGVNFTMLYCLIIRNFKEVFKNEELKWYIVIVAIATILISMNIYPLYKNAGESFRGAFFQVSSIITTTGFCTADFNLWPVFSQSILILLMFFGACAGSTGGGLKIIRVMMLVKAAIREIRHAINPRAVMSIKIDRKSTDEETVSRTGAYFALYMVLIGISLLIVSLDKMNFTESLTSVITCINNIGPGLGKVGPVGNFSELSVLSKWVLSFDMLVGRLELLPVIAMFHPSFWR